MFDTIYIEESVREHARARKILRHFKSRQIIECRHYGEVFNPKAQNFRLQKQNPALILANKQGKRVCPAPDGYGVGAQHNYYFSHMLNCIYDCRYCFLQGMYKSAHTVLFINYEDFLEDIQEQAKLHNDQPVYFFSGYDGDSLALEPLSQFAETCIPALKDVPNAWLELRSKSTQIRQLIKQPVWSQCIIAFSFTPEAISQALEHKVPPLNQRIDALAKLQQAGWNIGLRFDPLIYCSDYEAQYQQLFERIFTRIDSENIHSISTGGFRMPAAFYEQMTRLYPGEKLFASPVEKSGKMVACPQEARIAAHIHKRLLQYISPDILFPCRVKPPAKAQSDLSTRHPVICHARHEPCS